MKVLLLGLLVFASTAFANEIPQYTYQDGILQGRHQEQLGNGCVESSSESESAAATGFSTCADDDSIAFTVESGGAIYILTPKGDSDPSKGGLVIRALIPHSVLANLPPHTPIKLRSDGRHFFVKMGDRESMYSVVRVQ